MALKETVDCIESVIKQVSKDDVIIVVDNASPNNTGMQLLKKYKNNRKVLVVINDVNQGFARGNNLGIKIALKRYKCDFVICLNNDTLINKSGFRDLLIDEYEKHGFSVAGPKIIQSNGMICYASPTIPIHTTSIRACIGLISFIVRWILSFAGLDIIFERLFDKAVENNELSLRYCENVQLLGCCFIFTPKYFEKNHGFVKGTFLYLEELLLYLQTKKTNQIMAYDPELEIVHLGQISTHMSNSSDDRKYRRFRYKEHIKSFITVIKYIGK